RFAGLRRQPRWQTSRSDRASRSSLVRGGPVSSGIQIETNQGAASLLRFRPSELKEPRGKEKGRGIAAADRHSSGGFRDQHLNDLAKWVPPRSEPGACATGFDQSRAA